MILFSFGYTGFICFSIGFILGFTGFTRFSVMLLLAASGLACFPVSRRKPALSSTERAMGFALWVVRSLTSARHGVS